MLTCVGWGKRDSHVELEAEARNDWARSASMLKRARDRSGASGGAFIGGIILPVGNLCEGLRISMV